MAAAFLTTIFFSLSVIFASRSAKLLGGTRANAARITVALAFLALWAHAFGAGMRGPALGWFFASGVIGFGMGDIGLFGAITRIGPRLSILLTQCLAAPIAAVAEWAWLGTALHLPEALCAALILAGVALALAPDHGWEGERRVFWIGVAFGVVSALGQALGAVVSRKAYEVSTAGHFAIDGWSAAYQRILGGALTIWIFTWFLTRKEPGEAAPAPAWRKAWRAGRGQCARRARRRRRLLPARAQVVPERDRPADRLHFAAGHDGPLLLSRWPAAETAGDPRWRDGRRGGGAPEARAGRVNPDYLELFLIRPARGAMLADAR